MSLASVISTWLTVWPLMSMPRMSAAFSAASSGLVVNFTPPALPRPPVFTWALTMTLPPMLSAAARASSTVSATTPGSTGMPCLAKSSFAWYSNRSTVSSVPWLARMRSPGQASAAQWVRRRSLDVQRSRFGAGETRVTWVSGGGVDLAVDPVHDRLGGGAGGEDLRDTRVEQGRDVTVGDDAAAEHEDVRGVARGEQLDHAREERVVGAGQDRQADDVGVLLDRRLDDLLGRLVQAGVDDLHARVAKRAGDDLGPAVVAIEARLRDDDADLLLCGGRHLNGSARPQGRSTGERPRILDGW